MAEQSVCEEKAQNEGLHHHMKELQHAVEEKDKLLTELERSFHNKDYIIEELQKALEDKETIILDTASQIDELERALGDKDSIIGTLARQEVESGNLVEKELLAAHVNLEREKLKSATLRQEV